MQFYDINAYIGCPTLAASGAVSAAGELLAVMDRSGISKALVWHIMQQSVSAPDGNTLLAKMIGGQERLPGCWTILPPQTGEIITANFFRGMSDAGVCALRAMPDMHGYQLNRTVFGAFFDEVSQRRIPLLLSLERGVTWPHLYDFLNSYPEITVVICDVGIWGQDRQFWPLLERYPRVFVETSLVSMEAGGLMAGVRRFGAGRFLFGSGFPVRYPEAAMLDLLHADISADDKELIAHTNFEKLIAEVQL